MAIRSNPIALWTSKTCCQGIASRHRVLPAKWRPFGESRLLSVFVTIALILFAVLFIVSAVVKPVDIPSTAAEISAKVPIPSLLQPYAAQLETAVAMSTPQLLAVAAGTLEVICGLMIAFNLGVRFFSFLLILFVIAVTFYINDFWTH